MVGEPVWADPDPGWKVWYGTGLMAHAPLGVEGSELFRTEEAKERKAAEDAAAARRQREAEDSGWERMRGVERITVQDVLARFADPVNPDGTPRKRRDGTPVTHDIQDSKAYQGTPRLDDPQRPPYTALLREAKAEREARKAEAESTPASKADVGKLAASLARLKEGVFAVTGHKLPL